MDPCLSLPSSPGRIDARTHWVAWEAAETIDTVRHTSQQLMPLSASRHPCPSREKRNSDVLQDRHRWKPQWLFTLLVAARSWKRSISGDGKWFSCLLWVPTLNGWMLGSQGVMIMDKSELGDLRRGRSWKIHAHIWYQDIFVYVSPGSNPNFKVLVHTGQMFTPLSWYL